MKKNLRLILVITALGALGILFNVPNQISLLQSTAIPEIPIPISIIIAFSLLQQIAMLFLLTFAGIQLQEKTGLDIPHIRSWVYKTAKAPFSSKWILLSLTISFFLTLLVVFLDHFILVPNIDLSSIQPIEAYWWQGLLTMFYGGLTEEIMLRLFTMTLIVWLLAKIFRRKNNADSAVILWVSIVLASVLFGIGHLPATATVFGELTLLLVLRAIVLNSILGIWFGFLYWKKGLEYAMIAHMGADLFLHVILSNIFS
ncbi:CPBP family intramembrane glutamic endopeptidase [Paenibacillus sp. KS-LC4]|uniref:CPBP family intramembrane glutamic endopeptidase n=1 Tax=Paenibacillus sp. KS-LC4 TaxID=2979727 RepID=UPI0030D34F4B